MYYNSATNYSNHSLTHGTSISSKAITTYDICCDRFGFKRAKRNNFEPMQPLFARNATTEGYSVWMLAHSSLVENYTTNRRWFNFVPDPCTIREVWLRADEDRGDTKDFAPRVCFMKTPEGKYVFYGVYVMQKADWEIVASKLEFVKTYKRISTVYPLVADVVKSNGVPGDEEPVFTKARNIDTVVDKCKIYATITESGKETQFSVDIKKRPIQKKLIGKKVGDIFSFPGIGLTYQIDDIEIYE